MCDNKVILFFINNSDIVLLFFKWHIQHIFIDTYLKSTLTGLDLRTSGTYTTGPWLQPFDTVWSVNTTNRKVFCF